MCSRHYNDEMQPKETTFYCRKVLGVHLDILEIKPTAENRLMRVVYLMKHILLILLFSPYTFQGYIVTVFLPLFLHSILWVNQINIQYNKHEQHSLSHKISITFHLFHQFQLASKQFPSYTVRIACRNTPVQCQETPKFKTNVIWGHGI